MSETSTSPSNSSYGVFISADNKAYTCELPASMVQLLGTNTAFIIHEESFMGEESLIGVFETDDIAGTVTINDELALYNYLYQAKMMDEDISSVSVTLAAEDGIVGGIRGVITNKNYIEKYGATSALTSEGLRGISRGLVFIDFAVGSARDFINNKEPLEQAIASNAIGSLAAWAAFGAVFETCIAGGSLIAPGPGTLVGAAVGTILGIFASLEASKTGNDAVDWVADNMDHFVDFVLDYLDLPDEAALREATRTNIFVTYCLTKGYNYEQIAAIYSSMDQYDVSDELENIIAKIDAGAEKPKFFSGTEKNDNFKAESSHMVLTLGGGDDRFYDVGVDKALTNNQTDNFVFGGSGQDIIFAGIGNDIVHGGNDDDWIYGDAFSEESIDEQYQVGDPEQSQDWLYGGAGTDTIYGGQGDDHIFGDAIGDISAYDETRQELGNSDHLHGGSGDDTIYGGVGHDVIYGDDLEGNYSGKDHLYGGSGADWIYGGADDDVIYGETKNSEGILNGILVRYDDHLYGGAGTDTIYGGQGDDKIYGDGNDDISGKDETRQAGGAKDVIYGGHGDDEIYGGVGDDEIYGDGDDEQSAKSEAIQYETALIGDNDDLIYGGNGDDTIYGGLGDDIIYGDDQGGLYTGDDTIHGGSGEDIIYGGKGDDTIYGESGDNSHLTYIFGINSGDKIYGGDGKDKIYGGRGNDKLYGDGDDLDSGLDEKRQAGGDADELYGGEGDDLIFGGVGADKLYGDGDDRISGSTEDLQGGGGDDALIGGSGDDHLYGGKGDDRLYGDDFYYADPLEDYGDFGAGLPPIAPEGGGYEGSDHLYGGSGNDKLYGGKGNDYLYGEGDSSVGYDQGWFFDGFDDELYGGQGDDELYGGVGDDELYGDANGSRPDQLLEDAPGAGSGDDKLYGGGGNDKLWGGKGNDILYGDDEEGLLTGNDHLYGGDGSDHLYGGQGRNHLEGGSGKDRYYIGLGGYDTIVDSDHSGAVYFGSDQELQLKGGKSKSSKIVGIGSYYSEDAEGNRYTYVHYSASPQSRGLLRILINGRAVGEIKDFKSGDLGIRLEVKPKEKENDDFITYLIAFRPVDPLALDLDGKGIKTVGQGAGVLFDHNGDGVKQRTGWLDSGDGWLVYDRNEDGWINDGAELFGENTLRYDGLGNCEDAFSALAQEDTNGDGVVNNLDDNWEHLKVWRDLNQNGLSEEGELFGLDELGIVSLNLDQKKMNQTVTGGRQTGQGTYTREDGSTGLTGQFDLSNNPFHREYTEDIEIPEHLLHLPTAGGSGSVRDLLEAVALEDRLYAEAGALSDGPRPLRDALTAFMGAEGRAGQMAAMEELLYQWALTGTLNQTLEERCAGYYQLNQRCIPGEDAEKWNRLLLIMGAFNGRYVITLPKDLAAGENLRPGVILSDSPDGGLPFLTISWDFFIQRFFDSAYEALFDSIYYSLVTQTRLAPIFELIEYAADPDTLDLQPDLTRVTEYFRAAVAADPLRGLSDLMDFVACTDFQLLKEPWYGADLMKELMDGLGYSQEMMDVYAGLGIGGSSDGSASFGGKVTVVKRTKWVDGVWKVIGYSFTGDDANNGIYGGSGDDSLSGRNGNDVLDGGAGNDHLYGGQGEDVLRGGSGDDQLWGGTGEDVLDGGGGNDYLSGDAGDDVLDGGAGDDRLGGGSGDDILKGGSGDDELYGSDGDDVLYGGTGADNLNGGYGNDVLYGEAGDDTITGGAGDDLMYGGEGNDTMHGDGGYNVLYGGGGDDYLSGEFLYGEAGNDILWGGCGDDYLDGGSGNDHMTGNRGSDTFIYGRGYGHDVIHAEEYYTKNKVQTYLKPEGTADIVVFKDLNLDDLEFYSKKGGLRDFFVYAYDLVIRIKTTGETLTILNGAEKRSHNACAIQYFVFADGSRMTSNELFAWIGKIRVEGATDGDDKLYTPGNNSFLAGGLGHDHLSGGNGHDHLEGNEGDDTLFGEAGDDILDGGSGDDHLVGGAGNDILDGGSGDDLLDGGAGNDTFIFGRGYGHDQIIVSSYRNSAGDCDTLRLIGLNRTDIEVAPDYESLSLYGDAMDLVITIKETGETLTIKKGFRTQLTFDPHTALKVAFADGSLVDLPAIFDYNEPSLNHNGSDSNDILFGWPGSDTIYGQGGDDIIFGGDGDDTLYGGDGHDVIYGGAGSDVIYGGSGNDTIYTGTGQGARIFGGEGDDIIDVSTTTIDAVIDGGAGNDLITINYGNNKTGTILFGRGSGHDIANIAPRIKLTGLNADDIDLILAYNRTYYTYTSTWWGPIYVYDAIIRIKDTGESLTISNSFTSRSRSLDIGTIEFADGSTWKSDAAFAQVCVTMKGGSGDAVFDNFRYGNQVKNILFEGIASDDVTFRCDNENLLVTVRSTGETMTLLNWTISKERDYSGKTGYDSVRSFQFADGVTITREELIDGLSTVTGTDGDDELWAVPSNGSELYGGAGNDILYGGRGSDIFDGGAGDDVLIADFNSGGSDTFVFGRGYGHDAIETNGSQGVIRLKDLSVDDIDLISSESSYTIRIKDTQETLKGIRHYCIEHFEFAGGRIFSLQELLLYKHLVIYGGDRGERLESFDESLKYHFVGGRGDDTLIGGVRDDILEGGAGKDNLIGGSGDDVFVFAPGYGHDTVNANDSNQDKHDRVRLAGLGYDDVSFSAVMISAGVYDLIITIKATGETLTIKNGIYTDSSTFNPWGINSIEFGDGSVRSFDDIRDPSWFGDHDEPLFLQAGDEGETLVGGSGADKIYGGAGDDTIEGGAGADFISAGDGNDLIQGGRDGDLIIGGYGDDIIEGGDGDDIIFADAAEIMQYSEEEPREIYSPWYWAGEGPTPSDNDIIYGGAGNDILVGGHGSDILMGGDGDDTLIGDLGYYRYDYWEEKYLAQPGLDDCVGDDILDGGAGNDLIHLGGRGQKTVIFGRGSGHDQVKNRDSWWGDPNVHIRLAGLRTDEVSFTRGETCSNGYQVIVTIKSTGETLTLDDALIFGSGSFEGTMNWLAGFEFDDGYVDWADILTLYPELRTFYGSADDDDLWFWEPGIVIRGLDGNDAIYASRGQNKIYGDAGDDSLYAGEGRDFLSGGEGDDLFVVGTGHHLVEAFDTNENKNDVLKLEGGFTPESVTYAVELNSETGLYDLVIISLETWSSVRILSAVSAAPDQFNPHGLTSIEFSDGTVKAMADIYDPAWFAALPGGGGRFVGRPDGGEVRGTENGDIIYGLSGNDRLYGGGGDDVIIAGGDVDNYNSPWPQAENIIDGGGGNDTLIVNEYSRNTVVFGRGSGHDVLSSDPGGNGHFTQVALTGLRNDDVAFSFTNDGSGGISLIITIKDTGETLTLSQVLFSYGGENPYDFIPAYFQGIQFSDEFLDWDGLCLRNGWIENIVGGAGDDSLTAGYQSGGAIIEGRGGDDYLYGGWKNDVLFGGEGDDYLCGDCGDDALFGGAGNDILETIDGGNYLEGGAGDDTYLVSAWSNGPTVINNAGGGNDLLQLTYISPSELWFGRDGYNLTISTLYQESVEPVITVNNWFLDDEYKIDAIATDSSVITETQLGLLIQAMAAIGEPGRSDNGWSWTKDQQEALEPVLASCWQPRNG